MAMLPSSLMNMPMAARIGVAAAGVVAIALAVAFAPSPVNWLILTLVLSGVLVMALYGVLLKVLDKRRIGPFELDLSENAGVAPKQVRDPAARARLDELRNKFEQGLKVFREHGKDLYSIPWYMVIGEPGSGKTEAVRHSGVGFPPGLQDELQGSGGTLNMNWWFTNHAVILDTAGRLVFEEIEAGSTSEWRELLKMLRDARPNCPMNGMLLVIPADSLIRDQFAEIESKAGTIATQLDQIQRALGVRFPVSVIITKSDLINGFREFFDDINDPAVQQQMLGWSNPGGLDDFFDPTQLDQRLEEIRSRLRAKRLRLLGEGAGEGEGGADRLREADAMYAFPDSMMKLAPRLRRYLEMVFVQGEWSTRPLFIRGIYFTSSMREGSALDQDLADVLGVSAESLKEDGAVWERDRSFFLKDLFLSKVFRERGLVTRAENTTRMTRRRQLAVLGTGVAAIITIGALTWIGDRELRRSILRPGSFWSNVNRTQYNENTRVGYPKIVWYDDEDERIRYSDGFAIIVGGEELTLADLLVVAREEAANAPEPPAIFAPVASVWGDPFAAAPEVVRSMYEKSVLEPLYGETRRKLERETTESVVWSPRSAGALTELIRIETAASSGAGRGPAETGVSLEALAAFLLDGQDELLRRLRGGELAELEELARRIYAGGDGWPPEPARGQAGPARRAINEGLERFFESWAGEDGAGVGVDLRSMITLAGAIDEVEDAAREMRALGELALRDPAWEDAVARNARAALRLDAAWEEAQELIEMDPGRRRNRAVEGAMGEAEAAFEALSEAVVLGEDGEGDGFALELAGRIETAQRSMRDELEGRFSRVDDRIARARAAWIDDTHDGLTPGAESWASTVDALERARSEIGRADGGALVLTLEGVERVVGSFTGELERIERGAPPVADARRGVVFARRAVETLAESARRDAISASAARIGEGVEGVEARVTELGRTVGDLPRPALAMTADAGGVFDPRYHPEGARRVRGAVEAIRALAREDASDRALNAASESLGRSMVGYWDRYLAYWFDAVPEASRPEAPEGWSATHAAMGTLDASAVNQALAGVIRAQLDAASAAPPEAIQASPGLSRKLAELPREADDFESLRGVVRTCVDVLRAWGGLTGDEVAAREAVLEQDPGSFKLRFTPFVADGLSGVGTVYWEELQHEALEELAGSALATAREAKAELAEVGRGFPLCLDCERTLTEAELVRARGLAIKLGATGLLEGSGGRATIGSGEFGSLDDFKRERLRALRGDSTLVGAERRWFERVVGVLGLLDSESAGQELVILNASTQEDPGLVGRYPVVQVWLIGGEGEADRLMPALGGTRSFASDRLELRGGLAFGLPMERTVELRFFASEGQASPSAVGRVEAPWGGLTAVRSSVSAMDPDEISTEGLPVTGVWRLPVELSGPDGRPLRASEGARALRYVLGVRIEGGTTPDPSSWATSREWPG